MKIDKIFFEVYSKMCKIFISFLILTGGDRHRAHLITGVWIYQKLFSFLNFTCIGNILFEIWLKWFLINYTDRFCRYYAVFNEIFIAVRRDYFVHWYADENPLLVPDVCHHLLVLLFHSCAKAFTHNLLSLEEYLMSLDEIFRSNRYGHLLHLHVHCLYGYQSM